MALILQLWLSNSGNEWFADCPTIYVHCGIENECDV